LRNDGRLDASNVIYESGSILLYDKFANPKPDAIRYIDYGMSILKRELIAQRIPAGQASDLAPLLNALSREGQLAGFEATERFYEIGSPDGLRDLQRFLAAQANASVSVVTDHAVPEAPAVLRKKQPHKVGVLGGGLAGLTVSAHLDAASEVLEGGSRPGGHCQSVVEEGFTYDAGGPHIMFSRNKQTLDYMVS